MEDVHLPRRLSPSALDRYRECPRRFLLQDIEQVGAGRFVPTPELAVGNLAHKALELVFRLDPSERAQALTGGVLVERLWVDYWNSELLGSGGEEVARADADALLAGYGARFDLGARPRRLESWVSLPLQGGGELKTRLDRIDESRYGLRLIDYKTGRRQLDAQDLPRDTAAIVHLLAVSRASDQPVERISHYYLRTGEEVYWEPEEDDVAAAGERLRALLAEMRQDREFAPAPGPQCSYCPFNLRCPAGPAPLDLVDLLGDDDLSQAA
jgi:putative RecB family exonuclease